MKSSSQICDQIVVWPNFFQYFVCGIGPEYNSQTLESHHNQIDFSFQSCVHLPGKINYLTVI